MAFQAFTCPYCRTWFEVRGRAPRCPSCRRYVEAHSRPANAPVRPRRRLRDLRPRLRRSPASRPPQPQSPSARPLTLRDIVEAPPPIEDLAASTREARELIKGFVLVAVVGIVVLAAIPIVASLILGSD
jgi:hypothetical protein